MVNEKNPECADEPEPAGEGAVFDEAALLATVDGDFELAKELHETFEATARARTIELERATREGDANAISHAAHAMKGVSRQLAGERLGHVCERMETMARANDVAGALAILPSVLAELEAFRRAFRRWVAGPESDAA